MSSKKLLDDISINPEATEAEDETEVVEESGVKFPQYKGAKGEIRRQQEIISQITGEPIKPPFSRKEIVGGTRKMIRELPDYKVDRKASKGSIGQQKPDRPKRKL